MNVPKLLRTALFSVLALLVAGGLMVTSAQAQDVTVVVDQDDGQTISEGLTSLNSDASASSDEVGTLAIVAGDYTPTDADVSIDGLDNLSELNIEVRRDDSDGVNQLTIESLNLNDSDLQVNLTSDGDGFLFVQSQNDDGSGALNIDGTDYDIALQAGDLDVQGTLEAQDPDVAPGALNVYRGDGAVTGGAFTYNGAVSLLSYDPSGDVSGGGELGTASPSSADISAISEIEFINSQGSADNTVSFDVGSLSVSTYTHNAQNVSVTGDLAVDGAVSNGGALAVTGDLTANGDVTNTGGALTVTGTLSTSGSVTASNSINGGSAGSPSSAGNLEFSGTRDRSSSPTSPLLDAGGNTVVFNEVSASLEATGTDASTDNDLLDTGGGTTEIATLDANVASDGNTDSDVIGEDLVVGGSGTLDVGDVTVGSASDGSGNTDIVRVDVDNASGGTATVAGQLRDVNNNSSGSTLTIENRPNGDATSISGLLNNSGSSAGASITLEGSVDYSISTTTTDENTTPPTVEVDNPIDNAAGLITIQDGQTLTVDVGEESTSNSSANNAVIANSGVTSGGSVTGGIAGGGSLLITGASSNTTRFEISENGGQIIESDVTAEVPLDIDDGSGQNNVTLGDLTADASVTVGDGAVGTINVGTLTANSTVNLGGVASGDDALTSVEAGPIVANANVNVDDNGSGALTATSITADGGTVDLSELGGTQDVSTGTENATAFVQGNVDIDANPAISGLDISGIEFHLTGSFLREGDANAEIITGSGTALRFVGTQDTDLTTGTQVEFGGTLAFEKEGGSVTLTDPIAFTGSNLSIASPNVGSSNELTLSDNLVLRGDNTTTVDLNGTFTTEEDVFVIVRGEDNTFQGSESLPNLRVKNDDGDGSNTNNAVTIGSDLTFSGVIELENEGITVAGGNDFSPAPETRPTITRFVSGDITEIDASASNATFNGAGNPYDLAYDATSPATATVASELTGDVADLTVRTGATVQLTNSDPFVYSGGILTVESGGALVDDGSDNSRTLVVDTSNTHTVNGAIAGINGNTVEVEVTATNSDDTPTVIQGNASADNDQQDLTESGGNSSTENGSLIGDLVIGAPGVEVQDVQETGNITVGPDQTDADNENSEADLTLGLATADANSGSDTDQTVAGIDVESGATGLALSSFAESTSGVTLKAGTLTLGANDLEVSGGNFSADETVSYSFDNAADEGGRGELVLSSGGDLSTANNDGDDTGDSPADIPNLRVEDEGNTGAVLATDVGVGNRLVVNAGNTSTKGLGLDDDTLDVSGSVVLNALQDDGSATPQAIGDEENETGVVRVNGATITVNENLDDGVSPASDGADQGISRLTVAGGSDVTVASSTDDQGRSLYVPAVFTLADDFSGTFTQDDVSVSVTGSDLGSGNDPSSAVVVEEGATGNVAASDTSRFFLVETGRGEPSVALNDDVTFDRLAVADLRDGGDSESASLGTQGGVLTVNDQLRLAGGLDNQTATNGSDIQTLALSDGATIERRKPSSPAFALTGAGALTEVPTFGESLNLVYTTPDDVSATFTSGREVPSASANTSITSVEVGVGDGSGNGEVDFQAVDTNNGIATGNVVVTGTFDLESGTVEHGVEGQPGSRQIEIADGGVFAQKNGSLDDSDPAESIEASDYTLQYYPNDGEENENEVETSDKEFLGDGAVSELQFVDDGPGNDTESTSGDGDDDLELDASREVGALTVNRSGASTLDLTSDDTERTLTVTGGSDLTAGTVNNGTLQTGGDVTVDGGNIGNSATLAFAGSSDQSLSLNGDEDLGNLSLAKTTPEGEVVPRVTVTGGGLDTDPDNANGDNSSSENQLSLSNGLLVIEGENDLDLGTVGFSRDLAEGDTSHVVGSVTRRVSDANAVAEYPVGSSNASYRPFGFIFTQTPTQATDITVTHVDENPGETGNLPITDNENVTVGENYPDYYWTTESSNRLSISGEYEAFAQAEGLPFPDQSAQDFRIIQRAGSGSDWSLVGDGTGYDNTPISESEGRVDVSTVGATADIRQSPTRFTVGVPTQATGFQIAGTVSYPSEEGVGSGTPSFTSGEGLGGVEVALVDGGGSDVATTTTSSDGSFTFEDVEALDSGNYTVEARTDGDGNLSGGDVDRGVSIADARRIVTARQEDPAFANAGFQGEIADVNDNGSANSLDALLVARNVVFGDALSEVPAFFAPSEQASAGDSEVGLQVAAYGDANLSGGSGSDASGSSLTASQSAANLSGSLAQGSAQTSASSESQTTAEDRTIEVPVRLQEAAALGAYEMKLGFPADAVSFEGASVPTGAEGDLLSKAEDGTLKLGWIGSSSEEAFQVDRGGEVAVLTFALKDGVEETSLSLSLESGQLVGPDASTLEGASLGLPSLSSVTVAPEKFALNGNYPNPVSNGQTQIEMDLPSEGTVTVEVYNALGQRVMKSRKSMQAGSGQTIRINGSDLASGQYFYRVEAELGEKTARETGRITVVN